MVYAPLPITTQTFSLLCNNLKQLNSLKLMLQTSTTDLLNLSSKISHNRITMTSPAAGTIPDGEIIPTLDGRILHNSSNNNSLIFKMLLAQADHAFLHQSSSNNSNSPRNSK
ncbi:hypothetical protein GmHk_06G017289 [Glycine max]|nr:hypothetical protein GmHk_06G017289 [Glycine max]